MHYSLGVLVIFVHGWSVRHPDYGSLPARFARVFGPELTEIWLSEYISYNDSISVVDLADAFERARLAQFPNREFLCVTHSTGGPVLRTWLDKYNGPLTHLIMLAPPNHGSALAQLGKSRLSRMKFWLEGVEPGQRILDWLELGAEESWNLNKRALEGRAPFECVVTGASPDRALYDHLISYTGEHGSDGVVRIPAANPNFMWMQLTQSSPSQTKAELRLTASCRSPQTPFIVLPGASHPSIQGISLDEGPTQPTSMLIVKVLDTAGESVNDYDLLFTVGPAYSPDALPQGFFLDRQRNQRSPNTLTYFFDYAALSSVHEFGFIITPRPGAGPVHYTPAEYRGTLFLQPDETTMLEIVLERQLEESIFTLRRA